MRLSDLSITTRILFAVTVPVLLVLGLASDRISIGLGKYREAGQMVNVSDTIAVIGQAVHLLQTERGKSAEFIGAGLVPSQGLNAARADLDKVLPVISAPGFFDLAVEGQSIGDMRATMTNIRRRVDDGTLGTEDSSRLYTGLISNLLSVPRALVVSNAHGELTARIAAYNQFSQAKELAGQERALGNGVIAAGTIDAAQIGKLAQLYGAQKVLLDQFAGINPALAKEVSAVGPDAQNSLASQRSRLFSLGDHADLSTWKSSEWHNAASERINAMRGLETRILDGLRFEAGVLHESALQALVSLAALLAVVLAGGLALSVVIGMGVVRPIKRLTTSIETLASGETEEAAVVVDSKDEIGAMAIAVRHAIDAAKDRAAFERAEDLRRANLRQEETQRLDQERATRSHEIEEALGELDRGLGALAAGDLRFRITRILSPSLDPLRDAYNISTRTLENLVALAGDNARSIHEGCADLKGAADDLARRTAGQAAALEEAAAALEEVATAVRMSAGGAEEARLSLGVANADTAEATRIVADTVGAMQDIARSSDQIGQIIGVIDEIAFQTNLLALNAGVEAARAGDAGKGFAVVAQEVRELAQRSAAAAREIKALVERASKDVSSGVALVNHTGEALAGIERHVQVINQQVTGIVQSTKEQSVALAEISSTVGQLDQITQQNAAMVEETNAATQFLAGETNKLREQLGAFRTDVAASCRDLAQDMAA